MWKLKIAASIRFLGPADPAAYAEMAHSLLGGRWLEVDYISMYFRKFPSVVSHPEETWPPLYSLFILPFFAVLGKTALATKLPSLLISCFALPPVTYHLAKRVSRSAAVAFSSSICVLFYEPLFGWSLNGTADITFGFLSIWAVLLALKGFGDSRWFIPMGVVAALSYYAKGTGLILILALAGYYLLRRCFGCRISIKPLQDKRFAVGILVIFLLLLPWFIRNTVHFNDPLYSSHKHIAGYVGWKPWEETTYEVYWDRDVPDVFDKLKEPGRLAEKSLEFSGRNLRLLFAKMDGRYCLFANTPLAEFRIMDISTWWTGFPALLGIGLFLVGGMARLFPKWRNRGFWRNTDLFVRAEYGLFIFVGLAFISFLSIFWVPTSRLTVPLIPLIIILGWATIHSAVGLLSTHISRLRLMPGVIVILLCAIWVWQEREDLLRARDKGDYPWGEGGRSLMAVGAWIKENAPGSVAMTQHPWGLHFYSEERAVQLPVTTLPRLVEAARHYGVTHLIADRYYPDLNSWVRGATPGLRLVVRKQDLLLFEIDYAQLPIEITRRVQK